MTNTHVEEILFEEGYKLTAKGARYSSNVDGATSSAKATKEIILAAGGELTPHILMLSGIGPEEALTAAKISVKKGLPAVRSNYQDYPELYMNFDLSNKSIPNTDKLVTTPIPTSTPQ